MVAHEVEPLLLLLVSVPFGVLLVVALREVSRLAEEVASVAPGALLRPKTHRCSDPLLWPRSSRWVARCVRAVPVKVVWEIHGGRPALYIAACDVGHHLDEAPPFAAVRCELGPQEDERREV